VSRGGSITRAFRQSTTSNEKTPMLKSVIRLQSQLLVRRAFKPKAKLKPGPRGLAVKFRPGRAGPICIQYET
jgi:hypothetical protein